MKAININTTLVESYLQMLDNLSTDSKLELISKLTLSVKSDISERKKTFSKSFGAWKSKKTAEEIITEIRNSRTFIRQTESFEKVFIRHQHLYLLHQGQI